MIHDEKRLAVLLSRALILSLCGTFAGALASEVENGIDAIEDAMMKGNTNTSSFFDGMDDLREGTSADTVPTPDDFPSKYNYGSGKIQDYSRDNMLRRLPEPEGNATVLNTAADPEHIQALYLWEEGNVPAKTRFIENMTGYFDSWDFRPYVTAIPVRTGVQPKGTVVLMAGGAYQFRGNYTDSLPTAAALRELGFQTFIVDYRLSPYTQEEGALDVARAVRFVRKNASVYGINPDAIAVMGFSAGGIQAGEFLMHYDEDVTGTALDSRYVPDELDSIPAHASAAGMIYSFYGRLSVGKMDAAWLAEGNLPPTFYVYGTEDPFYRQFQQQYDVIRGMGIPTGRIVLNGWPHGFGSDGGWVTDYAAWLENVFANLSSKESFVIDRAGGFSYHTETMELDTENGRLHTVPLKVDTVKVQIPIRGLQRCLFAGQIVDISRQGLIYLSAMFVLGAIFRETCLIWAQPVEDVLFLLGAGLYFRISSKAQNSAVWPPQEERRLLYINASWFPLSILLPSRVTMSMPGDRRRAVTRPVLGQRPLPIDGKICVTNARIWT